MKSLRLPITITREECLDAYYQDLLDRTGIDYRKLRDEIAQTCLHVRARLANITLDQLSKDGQ